MRNCSYENELCMQFHIHANESRFHKNHFEFRLTLKLRHKGNALFMMSKIAGIRRRDFLQNEASQNLESQIRPVLSNNDRSICHSDLKIS